MSTPEIRILVVEDDPQMRRYLRASLSSHAYVIEEAGTLADAERILDADPPSLVLLDLGMPDGDGIELVGRVRARLAVPIVVLSARGREADKIAALDAGADDYLTKPFGAGELLARIRVALRHAGTPGALPAPQDPVIEVGPIRIDHARHEVTVGGAAVHLTPIEFRLLEHLGRNAGRVLTHRHLLRDIWGPGAVDQTHYLRVHMAALRRKVERDPARPQWLVTEPGVGYRLRDAPP